MGMSLDSNLFYGVVFEESLTFGGEECEEDETEWDEYLLLTRGYSDPWDTCPKDVKYGSDEYNAWKETAGIDEWHQLKDDVRKEFGVDVGYYGTYEWTGHYIYVIGTESSYYWTGLIKPDTIATMALTPIDELNAKLDNWIQVVGVDMSEASEPGWHIAGHYG